MILLIAMCNVLKKAGSFLTLPFEGRTCYSFTHVTGTEINRFKLVALESLFLKPDKKTDKGRAQDDNDKPVIDSQNSRQSDLSEISPGQYGALEKRIKLGKYSRSQNHPQQAESGAATACIRLLKSG